MQHGEAANVIKGFNLVGNSLLLVSVRLLSKVGTVVVMVAVARVLGAETFGLFSALLALVIFAGLMADFGLVLPTIRSISTASAIHYQFVEETLSARLFWSILSFFSIVAVGLILDFPLALVVLFGVSSILEQTANSFARSFEGLGDIRTVTLYTLAERGLFALFVLGALMWQGTLAGVAVAYLIAQSVIFFFSIVLFRRRFGRLRFRFSFVSLKSLSLIGFPFLLTALFSTLNYRVDTLVLSTLKGDVDAGIFNAAQRVIDAQMFIPMTIMVTVYPVLSRLFVSRRTEFLRLFSRSVWIFLGAGALLTITMSLVSGFVIQVLYGSSFEKASGVLQILSTMLVFYFVNFLLSQTLVAMKKESVFTWIMLAAAMITTTGNILMVPVHGYLASAWVRVGSEVFMTATFSLVLWRALRYDIPAPLSPTGEGLQR